MIGTFFKLIGKALRMAISRPIQRFNIESRAKKYIGEEAKYFKPAPRAIGSLSLGKPSQYPYLEGGSSFKSIKQKRLEAVARRNQQLLEKGTTLSLSDKKSFSETEHDDDLIISVSNKLPVIKTVTKIDSRSREIFNDPVALLPDKIDETKPLRPLPKSVSLQLSNPAVIWLVKKVPPGRLDLNKFQELMINRLADETHWSAKQIAETYNIKETYAENIIKYFKQIRIIISPRVAKSLDYVARNDTVYNSTKHIIYHVDKSLRTEKDKQCDETFLSTDQLDPEVRELLDAGALKAQQTPDPRLMFLMKRPKPLQVKGSINHQPVVLSEGEPIQLGQNLKDDGKKQSKSDHGVENAAKAPDDILR